MPYQPILGESDLSGPLLKLSRASFQCSFAKRDAHTHARTHDIASSWAPVGAKKYVKFDTFPYLYFSDLYLYIMDLVIHCMDIPPHKPPPPWHSQLCSYSRKSCHQLHTPGQRPQYTGSLDTDTLPKHFTRVSFVVFKTR